MLNGSDHKTAILIFAQSAKQEECNKQIYKGSQLFEELNDHILVEVEKTGLPFFHISEELQKGKSFGERFTNAIQLVYDNGFDKVITVGNDSPQLKSKHLLLAAKALSEGKSVIGPSMDGGFYLLGLAKKNFKKDDFVGFSWQKQSLLKEIKSYLDHWNAQIIKLAYLRDIDSVRDIKLFLDNSLQSVSKKLQKLITVIFDRVQIESQHICNLFKANSCQLCDLVRGSP